jgi:hypothetical protein
VPLLELQDQVLDLKGQTISMPIRPAAPIGQSFNPRVLIPIEELVACFARDIELSAQDRHLLSFHQPSYKAHPLVHLG